MRTLLEDFHLQRRGAGYRDIEFLLTFEQWLRIWEKSGHLKERGRRRTQYVMARYGDKGPYSINNVKIITQSENTIEGHPKKHTKETRRKMSAAWKPLSKASFAKISESLKGKPKSVAHRKELSKATKLAQARMRAEGRHVGRPSQRKYSAV